MIVQALQIIAAVGTILTGFISLMMVSWELWGWDQPGRFLGIPLVNLLGWFAVATAPGESSTWLERTSVRDSEPRSESAASGRAA